MLLLHFFSFFRGYWNDQVESFSAGCTLSWAGVLGMPHFQHLFIGDSVLSVVFGIKRLDVFFCPIGTSALFFVETR